MNSITENLEIFTKRHVLNVPLSEIMLSGFSPDDHHTICTSFGEAVIHETRNHESSPVFLGLSFGDKPYEFLASEFNPVIITKCVDVPKLSGGTFPMYVYTVFTKSITQSDAFISSISEKQEQPQNKLQLFKKSCGADGIYHYRKKDF